MWKNINKNIVISVENLMSKREIYNLYLKQIFSLSWNISVRSEITSAVISDYCSLTRATIWSAVGDCWGQSQVRCEEPGQITGVQSLPSPSPPKGGNYWSPASFSIPSIINRVFLQIHFRNTKFNCKTLSKTNWLWLRRLITIYVYYKIRIKIVDNISYLVIFWILHIITWIIYSLWKYLSMIYDDN